MLTPQEVSQHAFAKANFGGYNMAMVDEFLDQLTEDYTALYKENAVLKSKMKVLVDKVEEYRATEDGMRKALLAAQRTAEEIVAEAEQKREELVRTAETEARAKIDGMRHELDSEQVRLTAAQNATTAYIAKLRDLCQHEMDYISAISTLTAPAPSAADKAAQDIDSSMQRLIAEEESESPAAPAGDAAPEEPAAKEAVEEFPKSDSGLYAKILDLTLDHKEEKEAPQASDGDKDDSPTRRIDFGDLKFGKDYEI